MMPAGRLISSTCRLGGWLVDVSHLEEPSERKQEEMTNTEEHGSCQQISDFNNKPVVVMFLG